ncbi:calumenin-A [Strongylocentrotus purpuratus]|uniref:Reticulocalbin-3 n=1 Tax=Strongylocentrotus purpuratus TaxID=7668 RepID=A0A7M7T0S0_STRPU|nr:calumenin-A [Strongylocentrotus purpuratus]
MMKSVLFAYVVAVVISLAVCKPSDHEGSSRVKQETKLSDQAHFDEHGKHNPDYDHDAFLGEEEAKKFTNLSPEESKEKLGQLFDRVDLNKNGSISESELSAWIEIQTNSVLYGELDRLFKAHNMNGDDLLTWAEYNHTTYSGLPLEKLITMQEDKTLDFRKKVRQDKARWSLADQNRDEALDREEYMAFEWPREKLHMKDVAIAETIEDIDKDGDGYVNFDEFMKDLWDGQGEMPDWVEAERKGFAEYRDKDGDGKLNHEEVGDWIMPTHYDPIESEAKHLMYETDENKDNELTKEEMILHFKLFVGSRVTNFGELRHDEF